MTPWYHPAGSTALNGWSDVIGRTTPNWQHTGLRVATLVPGQGLELECQPVERVIVPLAGSFEITDGAQVWRLIGRPNVWTGPTDVVYIGPQTAIGLTAIAPGQTQTEGVCQVAVAQAHATTTRPACYYSADAAGRPEIRGAGQSAREVRSLASPGTVEAESIIVCEVLTPHGNWSSYPPHKHDRELAGFETELEEIYYFKFRTTPGLAAASAESTAPFGYQQVSASDNRAIAVLTEVHDGDTVLVPFGWHGPSLAAPGYDMYYLNVMAGPGRQRAWLITDHPDHVWVRDLWLSQGPDPRLPFRG